jgi:hypothetical protein
LCGVQKVSDGITGVGTAVIRSIPLQGIYQNGRRKENKSSVQPLEAAQLAFGQSEADGVL